ncbi:MAG: sigma-70 family RNA polymerase sigma factor [Bacteroidales bacterium]|nr:sigma-70 family RNA polymerase sigma factor [Bacteroidales bacterium]
MEIVSDFWEKIYLENAPKLIGVCRRYVLNPELAEDLVHDAFLKAINKQSTYRGKGSFEGWLRQIVVNTALMYLRNEKNHKERRTVEINEKANLAEWTENENSSVIEDAGFTYNDLLSAIDCLPLHHKLVFNLYVIENFSHKQIAKQLNISEGTSKSHLARARKKLKDILFSKANSQKKEKTLITLLLPAFVKANPIDSLFRSRMRNFTLQPTKDVTFFLSQLNQATKKTPLILKKQIIYMTTQVTKFVVLPTILSLGAIYITTPNFHPIEKPTANTQQENRNSPVPKLAADTIDNSTNSAKETLSHAKQNNIPETIKKTPVIVKKTIVQRKTVKIKKTILVIDSTVTQSNDSIATQVNDTPATQTHETTTAKR